MHHRRWRVARMCFREFTHRVEKLATTLTMSSHHLRHANSLLSHRSHRAPSHRTHSGCEIADGAMHRFGRCAEALGRNAHAFEVLNTDIALIGKGAQGIGTLDQAVHGINEASDRTGNGKTRDPKFMQRRFKDALQLLAKLCGAFSEPLEALAVIFHRPPARRFIKLTHYFLELRTEFVPQLGYHLQGIVRHRSAPAALPRPKVDQSSPCDA